jgi:hypothetical protein
MRTRRRLEPAQPACCRHRCCSARVCSLLLLLLLLHTLTEGLIDTHYHTHTHIQQHHIQQQHRYHLATCHYRHSTRLFNLNINRNNNYKEALFTQVVTDIDDTIKSSGGLHIGGIALGGIDVQYPRGTVYPGVAHFLFYLSLGMRTTPAKLAVLTARAEEFRQVLQLKPDSPLALSLEAAAEEAGVVGWGIGPVLYGSLAEWIYQTRKGLRKFSNFERLLQQDPTGDIFQYIYVGDTGELDQEAGETMLREYPEVVKAVFLHVVSNTLNDIVRVPPPKVINGRPLVFFRTYVGAAVAAVQMDFMTVKGLEAVIKAARDQLRDVPRSSDKWIDLERDLERAYEML